MRRSRRSSDAPWSDSVHPTVKPKRGNPLMRRARAGLDSERGSSSLEFLTVGVLLLVPIVYLVIAVSGIQSAAMGAEGAARQVARVVVQAHNDSDAHAAAERALAATLADYGIERGSAELSLTCSTSSGCLARGATVTARVAVRVPLPLVPAAFDLTSPLTVTVEAEASQRVSRFWVGR